jgi:diacylglycerol kinase family enzyme
MDDGSRNGSPRSTARRNRRIKQDAQIVLVCNPRAGGRWRELAGILDSEEAKFARRIVTDSVEDIAMALSDLGREAKLICVYGGDGTVQRVLDRLSPTRSETVNLALLGGGTMNVTPRWCGFGRNTARNFRYVVRAFRSGNLLLREVPVLDVTTGGEFHRGFTFGMGPIVRLLDAYERGRKGKVAAVETAAKAIAAAWLRRPTDYERLLREMEAHVAIDGETLPYDRLSVLIANVTGQINPGVEPFAGERTRESFYLAAYAVNAREMTLVLPMLMRGWLPLNLDLGSWIQRTESLPKITTDSRYVNRTAAKLEVRSSEPIYTLDGEILPVHGGAISVSLGPLLKLAVGPAAGLRMAAEAVIPR